MKLRKTKIICTMGPAVRDLDTIKKLIRKGMNIARFNFSHGDHVYHREMIQMVRQASEEMNLPVALLLDTKGPEIRTGMVKDNKTIRLVKGESITLTTDEVEGTEKLLSISYKNLPREILPGKYIYIADGLISLRVESSTERDIHCVIENGGEIGSRKNVNVVGVKTKLPAMTEKDEADILFGIREKMDFIAASFIRKPSDVKEIQSLLDIHQSGIKIISKIEDEEGVENIDEIIRVSYGIMIARGDLGVQVPVNEIPMIQKRIILKCNTANKPVITATQMLDSMINNPKPTRAETTDVANAIFDGTDAIMLSGETASGKYPVEAVETMHRIAMSVETSQEFIDKMKSLHEFVEESNISNTIAKAAFVISSEIKASAIITPTTHGTTPRLLSKYRPVPTIIAATTSKDVCRRLLIHWGVFPIITELVNDSDLMINNALQSAIEHHYVENFQKVVIVAGIPINSPIMLNTIKVHVVCNVLAKGIRGYGGYASGKIVKANDIGDAAVSLKLDNTEILVTKYLDESFKPILKGISGIILEEFSSNTYKEMSAENPDLVLISGVPNAMKYLEDNLIVTLDGKEKLVYEGVIKITQ